jgi:hypothetical protein
MAERVPEIMEGSLSTDRMITNIALKRMWNLRFHRKVGLEESTKYLRPFHVEANISSRTPEECMPELWREVSWSVASSVYFPELPSR